MTKTNSTAKKEEQFFENYIRGTVFEFGPLEVDETEVLEFARRYDPQPFHIDHEAAKKSPYEGIITSGWQTCSFVMRALVESYFFLFQASVLWELINCAGFFHYVREIN